MKHFLISAMLGFTLVGCGSDSDSNDLPRISIEAPLENSARNNQMTTVTGKVSDTDGTVEQVVISVNGSDFDADLENNIFSARVSLEPGSNTIFVNAVDNDSGSTTVEYQLYFGNRISSGNSHSGIIDSGKLYAWGRNNKGQVGLGFESTPAEDDPNSSQHPNSPVEINIDDEFVSIAFGQNTSLGLDTTGQVWSWGDGRYGQLGQGTVDSEDLNTEDISIPTKVAGLTDAIAIERGYSHSLVLHADGSVSAFGNNASGQLGINSTDLHDTPQRVNISNIVQISAGSKFSLALDNQGRVWGWGDNSDSQLAQGDAAESQYLLPIQIQLEANIVHISAGKGHALAVTSEGKVFGWGLNASSQVGNHNGEENSWPDEIKTPIELPWFDDAQAAWANGNQSFVMRSDYKIYPWGQNIRGSLGIGSEDFQDFTAPTVPLIGLERALQMAIAPLYGTALIQDEQQNIQVFSWGWSFEGSLGVPGLINKWSYPVPQKVTLPEESVDAE